MQPSLCSDRIRPIGRTTSPRWLFLLLAAWVLAACRTADGREGTEEASLGTLTVVVHSNIPGRQLEVRAERLEPDGCQEGEPGCAWVPKAPRQVELAPSPAEETWSGRLVRVEEGNYRLEASVSVEGSTFETPSKVSVEVRPGLEARLHLVLRQRLEMPPHDTPHFTSLLLGGHPVEPGDSVQLTIAAGPIGGNLQLWGRSEDPLPQGSSACPAGGCNRGAFVESFPLAFDPALGLTLTWQAPADPGDFLHPVELELRDEKNAGAKLRFHIRIEEPCVSECDGVCVDHQTDPDHCGSCDTKCTGRCIEGACDPIASIVAGYHHTCALTAAGDIYCWGDNSNNQVGHIHHEPFYSLPVKSEGSDGQAALMVSAGDLHTCAILADRTARCWGRNDNGQLGSGDDDYTTPPSGTPIPVKGLDKLDYISVESSENHTCARNQDGEVYCWGHNGSGQLGEGKTVPRSSDPLLATTLGFAPKSISVGPFFTCSITDTDEIHCWGDTSFGKQFANGIGPAIHASAGYSHACALMSDGKVICWGDNEVKQVSGSSVRTVPPTEITGISDATSVDAGTYHTCALVGGGKVRCWGFNAQGQLGDGGNTTTHIPVEVLGITGAVQISVGSHHACALLGDETAWCWGSNVRGQLGRLGAAGGTRHTAAPVAW